MHLGVFALGFSAFGEAGTLTTAARHAEALGYESLWAGEHVVLPSPRVPASPLAPTTRLLDPLIALAVVAGATSRLRLGTGIVILPQRNPVVLAKELATLDHLSGGRLVVGVGIGYLPEEFAAIGVPYHDRAGRAVEHLEAMQALWSMAEPAYHGRYVSFAGVDAHPRPTQEPLPVVMGGATEPAFRRAVERAQGWYGYNLDLAQARRSLERLRAAQARYDRPEALGPLEVTVTPATWAEREAFEDLGVERLVLVPPARADEARLLRWLEEQAPR